MKIILIESPINAVNLVPPESQILVVTKDKLFNPNHTDFLIVNCPFSSAVTNICHKKYKATNDKKTNNIDKPELFRPCGMNKKTPPRKSVKTIAIRIIEFAGDIILILKVVIKLQLTSRALCRLGISIPSADNRC